MEAVRSHVRAHRQTRPKVPVFDNPQAAEAAVRAGAQGDGGAALPGLIFNGSKCVQEPDPDGGPPRSVPAGRLECTMQV